LKQIKGGTSVKKRLLPIFIATSLIITILTGCKDNSISDTSKLNNEVTLLKKEEKHPEVVSLPVYTINEDNYELIEVEDYIQIYTNTSMEEKLKTIADYLSKSYFESLPIEIVKIEDDIVYINLKEDVNNKFSWSTYYFQGSYGGRQTATKLIETFLQRNYKEDWIKGVKFMYNDQVDWGFEHLGDDFPEIHYR
jgi:hypothetical protein